MTLPLRATLATPASPCRVRRSSPADTPLQLRRSAPAGVPPLRRMLAMAAFLRSLRFEEIGSDD